jgi:flagellar basal-body rod protein FlgB
MDANALRFQVTADNLSKAEVPNYKRKTVSFERELRRAIEAEQKQKEEQRQFQAGKTGFAPSAVVDYRTIRPRLGVDYQSTVKANGNNVDAEQEAMEVLKTQLNYRLLSSLQAFEFRQIQTAMRKN